MSRGRFRLLIFWGLPSETEKSTRFLLCEKRLGKQPDPTLLVGILECSLMLLPFSSWASLGHWTRSSCPASYLPFYC